MTKNYFENYVDLFNELCSIASKPNDSDTPEARLEAEEASVEKRYGWLVEGREIIRCVVGCYKNHIMALADLNDMLQDAITLFQKYGSEPFMVLPEGEQAASTEDLKNVLPEIINNYADGLTQEHAAIVTNFWHLCAKVLAGNDIQDFLTDIRNLVMLYRKDANNSGLNEDSEALANLYKDIPEASELIRLVAGYLKFRQKQIMQFEANLSKAEDTLFNNMFGLYLRLEQAKNDDDGLFTSAELIKEFSAKKSNYQILLENTTSILARLGEERR